MRKTLKDIWKARNNIFQGIKNDMFRKKHIEKVAKKRLLICNTCEHLDKIGDKCYVPGTQPCCGLCGCKLKWKVRCLAEACDINKWPAIITYEEESSLRDRLN